MSSPVAGAARRSRHPLVGAACAAAPAVLAALLGAVAAATGVRDGALVTGATAFLAMGAAAGFAVSGST